MSKYRSKQHHLEKGPGICVRLVADAGLLTEVELVLAEKGITWMLEADRANPFIEKKLEEWFKHYAQRQEPTVELPLNFSKLPEFTSEVLQTIRKKAPFGTVLSYKDVAMELRHPRASRAVGNACGRNPMPLLVPCHRIIASDGSLGGFSIDPSIKTTLLAFEK